ncbi:MAG: tRNA-dihydrouridine synthase, partial [Candidatus Hydromicrobium sp.]|nr:tRNA-dihydrouridine synthase [Candidatus Hydromicrobium sp.]
MVLAVFRQVSGVMYQNEKSIGTYFIHVTFAGGLIYILPKTVTLVFIPLNNALINFIGEVGIDVSRIEDSFQSAWELIMEENILRIMFLILIIALFAISIHGRTVRQGFSGDVDYELIKKVKEKVKIPV